MRMDKPDSVAPLDAGAMILEKIYNSSLPVSRSRFDRFSR